MDTLKGKKAVVTGGSRGLGLGIVEALVAHGADVTVVARHAGPLADIAARLGVAVVQGDVADERLARQVLEDVRPAIVVLNAGATPVMGPLHELSWDDFNRVWEVDVKAGFHWLQTALRLPLPAGSRVLVGSSGAAQNGSPLSGSYAGAKRMLWFMAEYANGVAKERGLDLHCQALIPMQIIGETGLGQQAAAAYARRKGVPIDAFLGALPALPPRQVGDYVVALLTDPRYAPGVAFGLRGDLGIVSLDS
jgi:NAD(P)-dependent dehydrogenase (short-subunit alcohol dehydrogenase family)